MATTVLQYVEKKRQTDYENRSFVLEDPKTNPTFCLTDTFVNGRIFPPQEFTEPRDHFTLSI